MKTFEQELAEIAESGLYRRLCPSLSRGERIFDIGRGKNLYNFATNDYLGISDDVEFQDEFFSMLSSRLPGGEFLMSALSSRLLGGDNPAFGALENYFQDLYSSVVCPKSALLFNGGYHANTGVLPALASSCDAIFCDKLAHASIIDALKLSRAKFFRFAHNDCDHLERLLAENRAKFERAFIVTESVFSMDGDFADLPGLIELKKKYQCMLYVDEAHSFGLFGERGLGWCAETAAAADVDIIMCTLGKAAASFGAVVFTTPVLREILINKARTFIFTTAMPPLCALWTRFIFEKIERMDDRRKHLRQISQFFRQELRPLNTLGASQIVPIIIGDESKTIAVSGKMLEKGWWPSAVRYPTVPKNSARLRLSLNAKMQKSDLEIFASELKNTLKHEI